MREKEEKRGGKEERKMEKEDRDTVGSEYKRMKRNEPLTNSLTDSPQLSAEPATSFHLMRQHILSPCGLIC